MRTRNAPQPQVRRGLACMLLCATAGLLLPAGALAAQVPMHSLASSRRQLRSTLRYWTPARLRRAAANSDLPVAGNSSAGQSASAAIPGGEPHLVPPRPPSGAEASSDQVADPTQLPYRTVGLLVGRDPTGPFGCSATAVDSPNASLILTAGHCVKEKFWTRMAVFVPGFHDGQTPFGIFPATIEIATPGWLRSENDNFDVGAMVLARNAAGQRVEKAIGAAGLATGQSRNQTFDVYGYPAQPPFDANKQWHCQSPYLGIDPTSLDSKGPPTMQIACDLTEGASGGGWLLGGQYVDGLTSYGYRDQPGVLYGPYFGRAVWNLYRAVRSIRPGARLRRRGARIHH